MSNITLIQQSCIDRCYAYISVEQYVSHVKQENIQDEETMYLALNECFYNNAKLVKVITATSINKLLELYSEELKESLAIGPISLVEDANYKNLWQIKLHEFIMRHEEEIYSQSLKYPSSSPNVGKLMCFW